MKRTKVKLKTEYRYRDEIVTVIKRIKNSYTEKWRDGWGKRAIVTKMRINKEMSFLLSNGVECFARDLDPFAGGL